LTYWDGQQANTIAEKEEMLRRDSFPQNEYDKNFQLTMAEQAHQSVTEQAVERAQFSQSITKAPGLVKPCFGAVRPLWKWDKKRIVELVKSAIWRCRHPAVWKRVSGVVIRKPGKDDYTKLTAFCSISLLSCIGKVIGNVVAELLPEEAEKRGVLSDGQFGSRKRPSAIDVAANMVDSAHAA
jgi:hypothetical protein